MVNSGNDRFLSFICNVLRMHNNFLSTYLDMLEDEIERGCGGHNSGNEGVAEKRGAQLGGSTRQADVDCRPGGPSEEEVREREHVGRAGPPD